LYCLRNDANVHDGTNFGALDDVFIMETTTNQLAVLDNTIIHNGTNFGFLNDILTVMSDDILAIPTDVYLENGSSLDAWPLSDVVGVGSSYAYLSDSTSIGDQGADISDLIDASSGTATLKNNATINGRAFSQVFDLTVGQLAIRTDAHFTDGIYENQFGFKWDSSDSRWRPAKTFFG
jgi:hypothetical protein